MRETWVGRVENIVVTKENSAADWVVVRLSNRSHNAPNWYSLDLSHRTPTSMAIYNQLRDARKAGSSIRLTVNRMYNSNPDWQEAVIIAIEDPALPSTAFQKFN